MSKRELLRLATFICVFVSVVFLGQNKVFADEIKTTEDNIITDWKKLASMPTSRENFRTEVVDGKIYAIGGDIPVSHKCLSSTEVYDPSTDKWTTLASMPTSREGLQTEVIDGKIYAIGGNDTDKKPLSTTEVYNPSTNSWTKLNPMSEARGYFQSKVINGKIYVFGGSAGTSLIGGVEVYDPATDKWTKLASMSIARNSFQIELINEKIYAMGGYDGKNYTPSTEVYDILTNKWTTLASMSEGRNVFQTKVINGKIYAMGGHNGKGFLASTEVYDILTDKWTTLATMPNEMGFFQAEVINGKIYALKYGIIAAYDPTNNTWTKADLSIHYYSLQTEVISGKIYVIEQSSVAVYTPSGGTTNPEDPTNPSKLIAVGGDAKVDLTWPIIKDATSYTIKRSTSTGGPYTQLATGITGNTYTDTGVTNGTTYYYVVTVIKDGSEVWNSNEASATPIAATDPVQTGKQALLVITMQNGERKEYDLTMEKINDFLTWYNNAPVISPTYVIEKNYNKASFTSRKDYISYSQIASVEVNEYGN